MRSARRLFGRREEAAGRVNPAETAFDDTSRILRGAGFDGADPRREMIRGDGFGCKMKKAGGLSGARPAGGIASLEPVKNAGFRSDYRDMYWAASREENGDLPNGVSNLLAQWAL